MRALVKAKPEVGIWLQDIEQKSIGHNDVRIKINKTAICGTDIHIYNWDKWAQQNVPTPLVTGHEFVGEIIELGSAVKHISIGDRVSGEGHIVCGFCRNCRAGKQHLCRITQGIGVNCSGAFCENFVMPATNVYKIPDDISDDLAAIFDPFGNAVHTCLSFDLVGEDVLIVGAGPIGIMAAAICKHVGARNVVITDINPYRLDLAKKMGATRAINIAEEKITDVMESLNVQEGFDVCLEMSGASSALQDILDVINHGGKIALLGIPPNNINIDWNKVIFKGLIIKGIYGREMYETWYKMISMLQSGLDISSVITHQFSIDEFQTGFDTMLSGNSGKVLLQW